MARFGRSFITHRPPLTRTRLGAIATTADTVTVSDGVARAGAHPRTVAESVTVSEHITRTFARTVSEHPAISETATRVSARSRTTTSEHPSISETVSIGHVAWQRTVTFTVTTSSHVTGTAGTLPILYTGPFIADVWSGKVQLFRQLVPGSTVFVSPGNAVLLQRGDPLWWTLV